jgi:alanine dehydrogenase
VNFGVPKEVRNLERRVGLTPAGVLALAQAGHTVLVEKEAGAGSGFDDESYRQAGGQIVYAASELYGRADVITKVARPAASEHALFRQGQIIFSFLHLSVSSPDLLLVLTEREVTAVAYEMMQDEDGVLPVLVPMSEIAGRLCPVIAGELLTSTSGGRGTLLGGIPGVPPAAVVILGAGVLGLNAVRAFAGVGAQVTVIDKDVRRLQRVDELFQGQITTMLSNTFNLQRAVEFADVLVGCILAPGRRAPVLVTRQMVRRMRPRSVIIDFSIDQGGCVATSRPTTLGDPTFIEEGVIHFCVPNYTSAVARTTSYAINNAALPFLLAVGEWGILGAHNRFPAVIEGINIYKGKLAHPTIAAALGLELAVDLKGVLSAGEGE